MEEQCSHLPSFKFTQHGNSQAGGYRPNLKEDEETDCYLYWVVHGTTVEIFEVSLTQKPLQNLHTNFHFDEEIVPNIAFSESSNCSFSIVDVWLKLLVVGQNCSLACKPSNRRNS